MEESYKKILGIETQIKTLRSFNFLKLNTKKIKFSLYLCRFLTSHEIIIIVKNSLLQN